MQDNVKLRQQCDRLFGQLKSERMSFEPKWSDLAEYISPFRPRWLTDDHNRGDKVSNNIIDSTATFALNTLQSGMMSGLTSPARPWFRVGVNGYKMGDDHDSDVWLYVLTELIRDVFLKSNLYQTLPDIYSDVGEFATAPMFVGDDEDSVMHFRSLPIGSYWIGNDSKGRVGIFAREFKWTARQIAEEFAKQYDGNYQMDVMSDPVKIALKNGDTETWFDICHIIMPNDDYLPYGTSSVDKKFISIYYEKSSGFDQSPLRKRGYDLFPVLCARWKVSGEDVYGTSSPGIVSLGDIKQLQFGEKELLKAIEKTVTPAVTAPLSMRLLGGASLLPGAVNYVPDHAGRDAMRSIHEININIGALSAKQEEVRYRIRRAFFEDLFLMLATRTGEQPLTATEVNERHEEKLLALGPVLEQLNQDFFDPLIDLAFDKMLKRGIIPPPPRALEGGEIDVEYISIMAQAQQLIGLSSVERFMAGATQLLPIHPELADKVNFDEIVDVYGRHLSLPPGVIRSDDDVAAIREQRNRQIEAQQQVEQIKTAGEAAKNLGQAEVNERNVLGMLSGAV